ncbi:nuclear transport factor 2 family protein [Flavobacterium sp. MK4S-17]|uniref:nuclear transport factor 2 family protein n=1 Tax=Flavobacterium sp. MK4S-17 TaxID=2543737 RepID=UPI00135A7DE3|nr:nuclear transport factor 2 family protein [Flavobacterium sp. MK4S-17]
MDLPKVIKDLVAAQNNFDSAAYAKCFSETAVVYDEGKTHNGRKEIEAWIADSNERYQATMQPVGLEENKTESILKAETSGNFPGSPIILNYRLKITGGLIEALEITG